METRINNGRIPWFRDRAFLDWTLFGGFETRRYFVTLLGNEQLELGST